MKFLKTILSGVYIVELNPFGDDRGSFARLYCQNEFQEIGFSENFVQINFSTNKNKGTFRGFHYQNPPFSETKLIRCVRGKVIDYVIDVRKGSPTFLQHIAVELSEDNNRMIFIPERLAHGYYTLEDNSNLIYFHTEFYTPGHEAAINFNDPVLGIELPGIPEVISEKDKDHPFLTKNFEGIY